jgi:transcriptional regulator with XRE-family HTH domain
MRRCIKKSKELGRTFKMTRKKRGMTQENMVAKLQVSGCDMARGTYAKIEAGLRRTELSELRIICNILGLDYNAIVEYDKTKGEHNT